MSGCPYCGAEVAGPGLALCGGCGSPVSVGFERRAEDEGWEDEALLTAVIADVVRFSQYRQIEFWSGGLPNERQLLLGFRKEMRRTNGRVSYFERRAA